MSFQHDSHTLQENNQMLAHHRAESKSRAEEGHSFLCGGWPPVITPPPIRAPGPQPSSSPWGRVRAATFQQSKS